MRAVALCAVVAAALAASAGTPASGRAPRPTVLAVEEATTTSTVLERLDAGTLRRVSKRFELWHDVGLYLGRSPTGLLAFGDSQYAATLHFIGQRPFRLRGAVALGSGNVDAILWPTPGTLLALRAGPTETEVARVDPISRRVLDRRSVEGREIGLAQNSTRVVFLLAPPGTVGPLRLGVLDSDGSLRTVALTIAGGQDEGLDGRLVRPGLALDPSGARAVAGTPEGPLAEVDLATLHVTYHVLPSRSPALARKGGSGLTATAVWAGNVVAIAGSHSETSIVSEAAVTTGQPTGLVLVDTRDWSARRAEDGVSDVMPAGGGFVAWGLSWIENSLGGETAQGAGLSVYSSAGTPLAHLFGTQRVAPDVAGRFAYVHLGGPALSIVDLSTGALLRRVARRRVVWILAPG